MGNWPLSRSQRGFNCNGRSQSSTREINREKPLEINQEGASIRDREVTIHFFNLKLLYTVYPVSVVNIKVKID